VFAARRDTRLALQALTVLVSGLDVRRERLAEAASDPLLLATDAAEALVQEGVPFREAHERVAAAVRDGTFDPEGDAAASVAARDGIGPGGVREAIAVLRRRFGDNL
jgi:argininosuccinate lyase